MAGKVYQGDVGTIIEVDMKEDISAAIGITFKITKPDGTTTTWAPSIYGTNYLRYAIQSNDLDDFGEFLIQPNMTIGSWVGSGKTVKLNVRAPYN